MLLQRKTAEELEVLHYANQVASAAHVQVSRNAFLVVKTYPIGFFNHVISIHSFSVKLCADVTWLHSAEMQDSIG